MCTCAASVCGGRTGYAKKENVGICTREGLVVPLRFRFDLITGALLVLVSHFTRGTAVSSEVGAFVCSAVGVFLTALHLSLAFFFVLSVALPDETTPIGDVFAWLAVGSPSGRNSCTRSPHLTRGATLSGAALRDGQSRAASSRPS